MDAPVELYQRYGLNLALPLFVSSSARPSSQFLPLSMSACFGASSGRARERLGGLKRLSGLDKSNPVEMEPNVSVRLIIGQPRPDVAPVVEAVIRTQSPGTGSSPTVETVAKRGLPYTTPPAFSKRAGKVTDQPTAWVSPAPLGNRLEAFHLLTGLVSRYVPWPCPRDHTALNLTAYANSLASSIMLVALSSGCSTAMLSIPSRSCRRRMPSRRDPSIVRACSDPP